MSDLTREQHDALLCLLSLSEERKIGGVRCKACGAGIDGPSFHAQGCAVRAVRSAFKIGGEVQFDAPIPPSPELHPADVPPPRCQAGHLLVSVYQTGKRGLFGDPDGPGSYRIGCQQCDKWGNVIIVGPGGPLIAEILALASYQKQHGTKP